MLAEAKLPEATVTICLRGDLAADHERAERELARLQEASTDSLAGSGTGEVIDRITDLEQQMREHTYEFRLRALPRVQWHELCSAHPPRRGDDDEIIDADRFILVNTETFWEAMIRACLVDPQLSDDEWRQLETLLTDHAWNELCDTAWGLNRRGVSVPFSRAASRTRQASAAG